MGLIPVSLEFERWRQKGEVFKAKYGYIVSLRSAWDTGNSVSKIKQTKRHGGHLLGNLVWPFMVTQLLSHDTSSLTMFQKTPFDQNTKKKWSGEDIWQPQGAGFSASALGCAGRTGPHPHVAPPCDPLSRHALSPPFLWCLTWYWTSSRSESKRCYTQPIVVLWRRSLKEIKRKFYPQDSVGFICFQVTMICPEWAILFWP